MSYILDALRRAEAERERGVVPGLQSQQHAIVDDDAAAPARPRLLVWAVAGLAAALVAVVAWNVLRDSGPPPGRPVVEGSVAPTPQAPVPMPTTPLAAPPQIAAPTPTPPTADAARPPVAATRPAARPPTEARRSARRSTDSGAATGGSESTTAKASAEARIYKQIDLPEDVRRDLPKLTVGGASYSGDAASRMVMINGQIFHEGDQLAPNLVLERIKLKSAVLSYKGYRYEVTF